MGFVIYLLIFIFLGTFAYAGIKAAPWFPTWSRDLNRFLNLAAIKPGEKFYDLGCGDGKLVFAAAKSGAIATGYEISLLPYLIAKIKSFRIPHSKIKYKDFWTADLSDADIVYIFLTPKANPKAKEKLKKELKKGARVIAYTWPIDGWETSSSDITPGQPSIYLYIMQ